MRQAGRVACKSGVHAAILASRAFSDVRAWLRRQAPPSRALGAARQQYTPPLPSQVADAAEAAEDAIRRPTPEELAEMLEHLFTSADLDGSGALSLHEFKVWWCRVQSGGQRPLARRPRKLLAMDRPCCRLFLRAPGDPPRARPSPALYTGSPSPRRLRSRARRPTWASFSAAAV